MSKYFSEEERAQNSSIKEKSLAAYRSGITTILIPKENVRDLDEIPQEVKDAVEFIPVSTVKQVLKHALVA